MHKILHKILHIRSCTPAPVSIRCTSAFDPCSPVHPAGVVAALLVTITASLLVFGPTNYSKVKFPEVRYLFSITAAISTGLYLTCLTVATAM